MIRNDAQHAEALKEIERLWDAKPGTPEGARLDELAAMVDEYENKREPWSSLKVEGVEVVADHWLSVQFSDGTSGIADFRARVEQSPFCELRDPKMFAQAYLDHGAVEWPCEVGIATEALHVMVEEERLRRRAALDELTALSEEMGGYMELVKK